MKHSGYALSRVRIPRELFGKYLRTGLGLAFDDAGDGVELKFNPWHDPATGRFTFKGGGGGSMGGGGAAGSWSGPAKPQDSRSRSQGRAGPGKQGVSVVQSVAASASSPPAGTTVTRNGYTYQIDDKGRTTQVAGTLTLNPDQARSRSAQAAAGGTDRLSTDDGGHYVAARFNGPTDSFNHFAQDANFNRGGYRVLENQWANDIKAGKQVYVLITSSYADSSRRPSTINVVYTVNGQRGSQPFTNSPKGNRHGK